ncbi:MAG TPA: L-seryl-tRNA(Sec) selenium transferase, partial [Candidatus Methylomirabilis sp.]|nr:L-seryl-tRNA(Sec) selenium transferase [Candidatus Methylomirabilis sp.]
TIAALEGTLYAYEAGNALESIPTLKMLTEPLPAIRQRARRLLRQLAPEVRRGLGASVVETRSQVGGGALPTVELPTAALALGTSARPAHDLDEALRSWRPAVLGRLVDDRLLLDCRTVLPAEVPALARRLASL